MVWTPGGRPTGTSGGGRIIEPIVPPTTPSDAGTYTDASGKPISRAEAERQGRISGPGATGEALKKIGVTSGATGAIPAGTIEGAKKAELSSERTFFLGTAQTGFRERPQELTQASRAAVVQSFYKPPSVVVSPQEQPYISPFHPEIRSLYGREMPSTGLNFGYYPTQPGSIAERYNQQREQQQAGAFYERMTPIQKGVAILGTESLSTYESFLSSRLGAGFDPTAGIPRLESISMGKQKYTITEEPQPNASEQFKLAIYRHYKPQEFSKMSFGKQLYTAGKAGLTSDVSKTGITAFAVGGGLGLVGQIPRLSFLPGLASKAVIGYTAGEVGLKIATKQYPSAIVEAGTFAAMTPLAIGGYKAGSEFKVPATRGLLEQASFVKNIRAYNVMAAERGSAWLQAPKTAEQYNIMAGEKTIFKPMSYETTSFIRAFTRPRPTEISIKPATAEAYTKLYGEREPTLRVRGYKGFIETSGKRIISPLSSEGRTISEYNKLVSERLKSGEIRSTKYVNVLDYLMIGGQKFTPSVRVSPRVKASTTGLKLTGLKGIRGQETPLIVSPFLGIGTGQPQRTYRVSIAEQTHRDILGSRKELKTSDIFGFKTTEAQGTALFQGIGQAFTQATDQLSKQIQEQTQFTAQKEGYSFGGSRVRPRIKLIETEKINFPSSAQIFPFGKKRRKVKRKARVFGEVSPIASIGEMFIKRGRK